MPEGDLLRAEAMLRRLKGATATLLGGRAAFTCHPASQRMFLRAMRESFAHHFVHNQAFRQRCREAGVAPSQLRTIGDLERLPPDLSQTAPEGKILLEIEGVPLDGLSIRRLRTIFRHIYSAMGLSDRRRDHRMGREMSLPALLERARELAPGFFWDARHGVPYVPCSRGALHVPRYSNVHVREDGRLLLFSPWPHSYAGLSLSSERRGRLSSGCACGLRSSVLEIL